MNNTVGSNIKRHRTKLNLTQQQLADILSVSRQTIASYEAGRTEPDIAALEKLAKIFDITVDELIGKTNSANSVYSDYKSVFAVGLVLNAIMFIRNMLFYIRDRFFYVEPGVITDEMRKPLEIRFTISEVINMLDRYFAAIFIIGIFFIIYFLVKSNKKQKLMHLIAIDLILIITFVINIEFSILINPRGGLWRGNYYDIMRQMFWDNKEFVIVLISLAIALEVYMLIRRIVRKKAEK